MDGKEWIEKGKKKLLSLGVKQWGMLLLAGICCLVIVFPMGSGEEEPAGEDGGRDYLHLLWEGNHTAGKREAEEILLRQMPEAVVENTPGGREPESG